MKRRVLHVAIAAALQAMGGCAMVPTGTARQTCELLQTASDEADMAPAWYIQAGEVLERCGKPGARAEAEAKACYAEARNGYRDSKECEAQQ